MQRLFTPLNPGRCTRDRRHACAPVLSGFCPALCHLTTWTTRSATRYFSKTVIVNPLVCSISYGNKTKKKKKEKKSYQRAVRIDNRPQPALYYTQFTRNKRKKKKLNKRKKKKIQTRNDPANANSSTRILIHSVFSHTLNKNRFFVVECLILNTTNPGWYLSCEYVAFWYASATDGTDHDWHSLKTCVDHFYVLFVLWSSWSLTALFEIYFSFCSRWPFRFFFSSF